MFEDNPPVTRSYLLQLPLELRQQIYDYILPSSSTACHRNGTRYTSAPARKSHASLASEQTALPGSPSEFVKLHPGASRRHGRDDGEIVWRRGCIALLSVNRQIHDECVDIMYGTNTFVVGVRYDKISFKYRWLLPSGLTPSRDYSFLDHFSQRNLSRIRNYWVIVEKVDSYTGMVKFNCGGSGLNPGLRAQVDRLVDVMKLASNIRFLHINLKDGAQSHMSSARGQMYPIPPKKSSANPQAVLDPFIRLRGLRRLVVEGSVTPEYAEWLENLMTRSPASVGLANEQLECACGRAI